MHRFLIALTLLLTAGCPPPPAGGIDAFDEAKKRGKLIVGLDAGYDPFEVVTPDGSYQGYDIDLVQALAESMELELEIKNVAWDGIIPALRTGKVDVIFSGMSVTEDRKRAVLFSEPYYDVGQVVVKRKGDERFKTWQDLNTSGVRIATQQGTTGEYATQREIPKAEIVRFDKADEACLAVMQERADACVFDHPFLMKYVAKHDDQLEGLWEPFTSEAIGAAMRKDSPKLKAKIDELLSALRDSGELARLQSKWFPSTPERAAEPSATEQGSE